MTTGSELALFDKNMIATITAMVDADDVSRVSVPVLKINYVAQDEGAAYPRGTWVVGQQKDQDGNVIEQGKKVESCVLLAVRNRYNYFNRKDTTQNCASPLHKAGDMVRGSKYKNVCGPACPYREKDINPRCKAQKVAFAVARTDDGQEIDSVMYIGGASYMEFDKHYKSLTRRRGPQGVVDVPPFINATILGSEKEKFDATVYFVGTFEIGEMFPMEKIKEYEVRRNGARQMIEAMNAALQDRSEGGEDGSGATIEKAVNPEVVPDPF